MKIFTFSKARQNLSSLLDQADTIGKVIIRRRNGRTYAVTPDESSESPLDVSSIQTSITTEEIVEIVRRERESISSQ